MSDVDEARITLTSRRHPFDGVVERYVTEVAKYTIEGSYFLCSRHSAPNFISGFVLHSFVLHSLVEDAKIILILM